MTDNPSPEKSSLRSRQFLEDAYAIDGKENIRSFYENWAEDYDQQMQAGLGYLSPQLLADMLLQYYAPGGDGEVIDIGCGTGLAGRCLSSLGFDVIDGLDLSADMLKQASSSGIYRDLIEADLTAVLPLQNGKYQAAICTGTFTHGHVDASAIDEIIRILAVQGVFAFTVHQELWSSAGFEAKLQLLEQNGVIEPLQRSSGPYFNDGPDEGWFCIYRKN